MKNQITCNDNVHYIVDDYPYGFRLRTQIRYWIESRPGFGQRMASQTLNSKTGNWNKPKYSTYSAIIIMYLEYDNELGKEIVKFYHVSDTCNQTELDVFKAENFVLSEYQSKMVLILQAKINAGKLIKWQVTEYNPDKPQQTIAQQAEIIGKITEREYNKLISE